MPIKKIPIIDINTGKTITHLKEKKKEWKKHAQKLPKGHVLLHDCGKRYHDYCCGHTEIEVEDSRFGIVEYETMHWDCGCISHMTGEE